LSTESRLVYLQCVILETLRLCPPAPLSVPHATSEDDIYHNWLIPANTTVIMNLHAIHHDPTLYPEPHRFVPERHLHYTTKDRPHLSFSTGRRVCVGIHLAERNLFLAASGLLSCFKFERENDALINVSEPRDIRSPAFAPPAYRVKIVPRHERVQALFSAAA
ncbi:cytochrome P450, partial [Dichotomocladium elegans]